jgi:hypothetical protein
MSSVTGAYQYNSEKYILFTISQEGGYNSYNDDQRYALLKPNDKIARHRHPLPDYMKKTALALIHLPDDYSGASARQTVANSSSIDKVFWWKEYTDSYKVHVMYFDAERCNEAHLEWDNYIPIGQYFKLIILTPFALIGDILTFPLLLMAPRIDG